MKTYISRSSKHQSFYNQITNSTFVSIQLVINSTWIKNAFACKFMSSNYDAFISLFVCIELREKCPHLEFFRFVFSRIRTEYREIHSTSPNLVQMRENTDQKNSSYGHLSRSVTYNFVDLQKMQSYQEKMFCVLIPDHMKNLLIGASGISAG